MIEVLNVVEIILWVAFLAPILYFLFFALASKRYGEREQLNKAAYSADNKNSFMVIFPAYGEDAVIVDAVKSFLNQDYPIELRDIYVVSDHMKDATNEELKELPINLLIATYENSSKAKALKLAVNSTNKDYDGVIILDADNVVEKNYLSQLNDMFSENIMAIQTHRVAKNLDSEMAYLDAVAEEINNTIFRQGHVVCNLPASLIGSGMLFDYKWFKKVIPQIYSAGEDKELEILLIKHNIQTEYAKDIYVYDEKSNSLERYNNQRRRWIAVQIFALKAALKELKGEKASWAIIDKIYQWFIPPRLMLIGVPIIMIIIGLFVDLSMTYRWLALEIIFTITCIMSIPKRLSGKAVIKSLFYIPVIIFITVANLFRLKGASKSFIHTTHGED